jgi:hypothetical protein
MHQLLLLASFSCLRDSIHRSQIAPSRTPIVASQGRTATVNRLSGSNGATTELPQRKAERQASAQFVDWMAVRERMTQSNAETEIAANPPNEADQAGYRLGLTKFLFIKKLRNRPDRPR